MKKFLGIFVGILMVALVSGCGTKEKTMTCTKETIDGENYKTTDTLEITYNSKSVLRVKNTTITETDAELMDFSLGIMKAFGMAFDEVNGITVDVNQVDDNKVKIETNINYAEVNLDNLHEKLGSLVDDDSYYSSTNVTIDQFKETHLEGYTCK